MAPLDSSLWYRSARENAHKLHLNSEALIAMHTKVAAWMGDEWIARQEARRAQKHLSIGALHPLFTALRSQAITSLVEVAELATYLEAFSTDPAFPTILEDLRSEKFASTLFELAMAYRWKRAGASVALSPALPTGRVADFAGVIGGDRFLVEVSAIPADELQGEAARMQHVVEMALKTAKPPASVAVELAIDQVAQGDVHGAVHRAVKAAVRRYSGTAVTVQLAFGTLTVRELGPDDVGPSEEWDIAWHGLVKRRPKDGTLYDAHREEIVHRSHSIYVRLPPDASELYDMVLSRFESERRQLSGTHNPRVVILDVTGLSRDVLRLDARRLNATLGQRLLQLPKVTALWLMSRAWFKEGMVGYRAITLSNPQARVPLAAGFVKTISDRERDGLYPQRVGDQQ